MKSRLFSVPTAILSAFLVVGMGSCEDFSGKPKSDSGTPVDDSGAKDVAVGSGGGPGTGGAGIGTGGQPGGITGSGGEFGGASDGGSVTVDVGISGACTPNAKECVGLQPRECDMGGAWQDKGAACPYVCGAGACTGSCAPATRRCNDLQPQVCDATGTWQSSGSPCAMICNSGSCAACTTNDKQCNGAQPQVCDATATWKSMGTPCPFVCNSTTGACAGVCTPGARQCSVLQPQVCNAAGAWANSGAACPFVCSAAAGTCSGTCVPGAKQCMGSQPQACDANGSWQPSGAACDVCNPCSASTGTCVVAAGTSCNDGNACTNNTTCQANGSCGGGTAVTCMGADVCHTVGACVPASGCPAPVLKTGTCDDGKMCTNSTTCQPNGTCGGGTPAVTCNNPCKSGQACQEPAGTCGGGVNVGKNEPCEGGGKVCDGTGNCTCRTKSSWNLLNNPGFDGMAGWVLDGASYDGMIDVDSCMGSGSVLVTIPRFQVSQCVQLPSNLMGSARSFWVGFRFKSSIAGSSTPYCVLTFYGGTGSCTGSQLSGGSVLVEVEGTNWTQASGSVASTADSTHFSVVCTAVSSSGYYDQIFVSTSSQPAGAF